MPLGPENHQSEFCGGFSNGTMLAFIGYIFTLRAISKYQPYEFIHKSMHNLNKYFSFSSSISKIIWQPSET
jgi:hypothetical protein